MMNGQQEDAMATATAPALEAASEREQRHCPECEGTFTVSRRYRPRRCPACLGKKVASGSSSPASAPWPEGVPAIAPLVDIDGIHELSALDRELTALRVAARAFEDLDSAARGRVMAWLNARYAEPMP